MSRVNKYRGKDRKTGQWVYGSHVKTATGLHYIVPQNLISNELLVFVVDPETVGQFTGLPDNNGKEIYEGDICNFYGRFGLEKGVIEFQRHGFNVVIDGVYLFKIDEFNLEVIGDIHDHPHLLEGQ